MTPHARPHIETHNRSRGHSAVAGAAYRLGVSLWDARTGTRHAYARRRRGEIVAAFTVAPDGAPAWATDPAQCWNRAEAAEKRKDAQVARDYRMPVPLGLDDQEAAAMAREMAEHIAARFAVPVSVGVHRDNPRDALGREKPDEKRGFHAHLYFPTRRLDGDGYGAKLTELSNKTTSAPLVDALNERWAALANTYTARAGLVADYDHRAHARDGDTAMPTLGVAACAMERRGITTDKGDTMKLLERLRQTVKKPGNDGTEISSEPTTTTTEEEGGQKGAAGLRVTAKPATTANDPRRAQAEQTMRAALAAEIVAETVHSRAANETEGRRKRLAHWTAHHPRPRWFLFWLRPSWERTRRRLQRAVERQEHREQRARRAQEEASKAYMKKRQRLTALSAKSYTPPMLAAPRERRSLVPGLRPTPPAMPGAALAKRLRLAGMLPSSPKATSPAPAPNQQPRRPGTP